MPWCTATKTVTATRAARRAQEELYYDPSVTVGSVHLARLGEP